MTEQPLWTKRAHAAMANGSCALALLLAIPPNSALEAQSLFAGDELALEVGLWLGEDFILRSAVVDIPFEGAVEFGSSLGQENALLIGARYTFFVRSWFGIDAAVAHASNDWTTVNGRIENGTLRGTTETIRSVSTVPFSVGAVVRVPGAGPIPRPFVTLGAGGVFYEFTQSTGPLTYTGPTGAPRDTVLFDLDLGLRLAPNVGVGLRMAPFGRVSVRMEGRMWFTIVRERLLEETFVQKNRSVVVSIGYFL